MKTTKVVARVRYAHGGGIYSLILYNHVRDTYIWLYRKAHAVWAEGSKAEIAQAVEADDHFNVIEWVSPTTLKLYKPYKTIQS